MNDAVKDPPRRVELWGLDLQPVLIVEWPSGVVFSNQVGGVGCIHPSLEGILVPLPGAYDLDNDPLCEYREFEPGPDNRAEERDQRVKEWLVWAELDVPFVPRTDEPLYEAWIPVRVREEGLGYPYEELIGAFRGARAIITYLNSD